MFSKLFAISFLFAFFVMAVNCIYNPSGGSQNSLKGRAGQGARGEIQADGGPSININPVNNAIAESDSNPYTSQDAKAEHPGYLYK